MSFLKKHYEKIILMVLLLVFIVAMVYLILIFTQKGVSLDDLKIRKAAPDYKRKDFTKVEFQAVQALDEAARWQPVKARDSKNQETKLYTDLLQPFEIIRSPHSKKLVAYYYVGKKDPWPPHELIHEGVSPDDDNKVDVGLDTDGGGIPDADERVLKLDEKNAEDDHGDKDNDGFDNFVEWKANTKIDDVKSHPSYINMLRVVDIERKRLPIRITRIQYRGGDDKKKWEIHLEVREKSGGRMRTRFLRIGDGLKIDGEDFKIADVQKKIEKRYDRTIKASVDVDQSHVILQPVDTDIRIEAKVKTDVYEPELRVLLEEISSGKKYKLNIGKKFGVGEVATGRETVTLVSLNRKKMQVTLQDRDGGKWLVDKKQACKEGGSPLPIEPPKKPGENREGMPPGMPPGMGF